MFLVYVNIVALALLLISIGLSAFSFHKIRKIHKFTYGLNNHLEKVVTKTESAIYNQIAAHNELINILGLNNSLPQLRGWAASPDFLLEIASHSLCRKPLMIVECSSGASTVVIARCCQINSTGHVYSLEHDPYYADQTREYLEKNGLSTWATVVDAELIDCKLNRAGKWYSLDNLPQLETRIDLLVIDGPPSLIGPQARYPALPILYDRLRQDCDIFVDDTSREEEREMIRLWRSQFPKIEQTDLTCEKGAVKLMLSR